VEDLRADQKMAGNTRAHCDRLFLLPSRGSCHARFFPADTGLIVADAYGAHLHCEAPEHRAAGRRREKAMMMLRVLR